MTDCVELIFFSATFSYGVNKYTINFVRERDKAHKTGTVVKNPPSSLQRASDWELIVDLKRKLIFPQSVAVTSLRPDMVLPIQEHKNHHIC